MRCGWSIFTEMVFLGFWSGCVCTGGGRPVWHVAQSSPTFDCFLCGVLIGQGPMWQEVAECNYFLCGAGLARAVQPSVCSVSLVL